MGGAALPGGENEKKGFGDVGAFSFQSQAPTKGKKRSYCACFIQ